MDPREMETLIQRLVANPHDEEALAYAHRAGTVDPRAYAILLEKVGQATTDPAHADDRDREGSDRAHRGRPARSALPRQGRSQGARRAARAPRQIALAHARR